MKRVGRSGVWAGEVGQEVGEKKWVKKRGEEVAEDVGQEVGEQRWAKKRVRIGG